MTQAELARTAGVSRALVGALEQGRHVPSVDAALRLARALGTDVESLFGPDPEPDLHAVTDVLSGAPVPAGTLVRVSAVGPRAVAHAVSPVHALAGVLPDAVVGQDGAVAFPGAAAAGGAVVAGCDPLLQVAERLLGAGGPRSLLAVAATSGQAQAAMEAGRAHGAVVHGPAGSLRPPDGTRAWRVASWRSGLASHPELGSPSLDALLGGEVELVQRAGTAASQQALVRAAARRGASLPAPAGPLATDHFDAARQALARRSAAVAMEPVARAMGLGFLELEAHDVQLWVPERWVAEPGIAALLDLLTAAAFHRRAAALPAYDLTLTGTAA